MKKRIRLHGTVVPKVPKDSSQLVEEFKNRLSQAFKKTIRMRIEENERKKIEEIEEMIKPKKGKKKRLIDRYQTEMDLLDKLLS